MNEEEATVKAEPEDDEENGRTTPVRKSVQEYEQVCGNENAEVAGLTNDSLSNEGHNPATINDSENAIAPGSLEDVNSNDLATGVAVKDEPQDMDLADLEQTLARFDGQVNEHGDTTPVQPQLEDSPPPAPPPPPEIVALNTDTEIPVDKIKDELPDGEFTDMVEAQSSDNAIANVPKTTSPSKLTAVPMSRLRVKPEFSTLPPLLGGDEEQEEVCPPLPQDFFDGILTENAATRALIRPKDEPIPDDFFDDLLVDKVQERVEAAETQDLEVKFSDRLKTLRELERKERKMHKKSKKKSRKRQRSPSPSTSSRRRSSRSPSPPRRRHSRSPAPSKRCRSRSLSPPRRRRSRSRSPIPRRRGSRSSPLTEQHNQKIMRWPEKSEFDDRISQMPTTSKRQHVPAEFDLQIAEARREQFKNEHSSRDNISPIKMIDKSLRRHIPTADVQIHDDLVNEDIQPHLPELVEELTAKQKRDRIMLRAKTLMKYLKIMETEKDKPLSTFLYTSIIRKLPTSHSYRNQHIYENRSPLHNVNNVNYKFNSHARRFNLEEWGLASIPPAAANIAKLLGCDAQTIYDKLKVIKIPPKIRKIKREHGDLDDDEDEELLQTRSSLFCSVSTQTDETVDILKRKPQGYDIGVQAVQPAFEIACQTLETESPSIKMYDNNDSDLPIMGLMREMNDNQLMALHDFAELLKEPPSSNAMDIYRLRQRMLDIYKSSQQPSAMSAPNTPAVNLNSYSSNESSPSSRVRHSEQQSGFRINSVEAGDGSYFSVNDPRGNFINYRNRDMNTNDPRNGSRMGGSRPIQRNAAPSSGPKYYGRGGLRR